jgi:thioredoxin reductase (NADPH)
MDPVILIVADPMEGARLLDELGRYRRDYQVEVVPAGVDPTTRLAEIEAADGSLAMVLADLVVGASDGVEVLARVRGVNPTARCVLLVEWGLRPEQMSAVSRALTLGVVDMVLTKPTGPRDEDFHAAITEDLGEWAWTTKPVVETVRIVGTEDGRGQEIHEVLDRLGVPSGLHDPD